MGASQSLQDVARAAKVMVVDGMRPRRLLRAAAANDTELAATLCKWDVATLAEPCNLDGDTVFHLAVRKSASVAALSGLRDVIARIAEQQPSDGLSPTTRAQDILTGLLNARNFSGETPLHKAAFLGKADAVTWLMDHGCNAWVADRGGGRTALHLAVVRGYPECVRVLCDASPPPGWLPSAPSLADARTSGGFTALHYAAAHNQLPIVRLLISFHADLSPQNRVPGWFLPGSTPARSTPLHIAALLGYGPIARAILVAWVEVRAAHGERDPRRVKDEMGRQPWQVAQARGYRQLAALMDPRNSLRALSQRVDSLPSDQESLAALAAAVLRARLTQSADAALEAHSVAVAALATQRWTRRGLNTARHHSTKSGGSTLDDSSHHSSVASLRFTPLTHSHHSITLGSPRLRAAAELLPDPSSPQAASGDRAGGHDPGGVKRSHADAALQGSPPPLAGDVSVHSRRSSSHSQSRGGSVGGSGAQLDPTYDSRTCGVCWDAVATICVAGCAHAVCGACAKQMVAGIRKRPLTCPFCRGLVRGFLPLPPRPGAPASASPRTPQNPGSTPPAPG